MFFSQHKERRYHQRLELLNDRYKNILGIFENEVLTDLNRLRTVSLTNKNFVNIYENYNNQYDSIKQGLAKDCDVALRSFQELLNDKNLSGIKEIYNSNIESLNSFEKSVVTLKERLASLFEKEIYLRNDILKSKDTYRKIKEYIYSKQQDVSFIIETIDLLFNKVDSLFDEFEQEISTMYYEEATKTMNKIKTLIKGIDKTFADLPMYCVILYVTIPQRIEQIENQVQEYVRTDYPLNTSQISTNLQRIKDNLKILYEQLNNLDVKYLKKDIDSINLYLNSLTKVFDYETKARETYFSRKDDIIDNSSKLKKQFMMIYTNIDKFKKMYVLDVEYEMMIPKLMELMENMLVSKSYLEASLLSNNKQPYSVINKRIDIFLENQSLFQDKIKKFVKYFKNLKPKAEELYSMLNESSFKLLQFYSLINDLDLEYFTNKYLPKYTKFKDDLEVIHNILVLPPINVLKANMLLEEYFINIENTFKELKSEIQVMEQAENSFVYCNKIRLDFESVNPELKQAEQNFFKGNFERSFDISVNILKRVYPERIKR